MLFCGIDLHSNNSFVVVTDDADKVIYSRRLPNNLTDICGALSPYLKDLFGVVVESRATSTGGLTASTPVYAANHRMASGMASACW